MWITSKNISMVLHSTRKPSRWPGAEGGDLLWSLRVNTPPPNTHVEEQADVVVRYWCGTNRRTIGESMNK